MSTRLVSRGEYQTPVYDPKREAFCKMLFRDSNQLVIARARLQKVPVRRARRDALSPIGNFYYVILGSGPLISHHSSSNLPPAPSS